MENKNGAMHTALGLQLNLSIFLIEGQAKKQKVIDFARTVLDSERKQRRNAPSPQAR